MEFLYYKKTICKILMISCTTENSNCTTDKHKLESGTKMLWYEKLPKIFIKKSQTVLMDVSSDTDKKISNRPGHKIRSLHAPFLFRNKIFYLTHACLPYSSGYIMSGIFN